MPRPHQHNAPHKLMRSSKHLKLPSLCGGVNWLNYNYVCSYRQVLRSGSEPCLRSSTLLVGLHYAWVTWEAIQYSIGLGEHRSHQNCFKTFWKSDKAWHASLSKSDFRSACCSLMPWFLMVSSWAPFGSHPSRLVLAFKSGWRVAVVVAVNCFMPKFCAAFGKYLTLGWPAQELCCIVLWEISRGSLSLSLSLSLCKAFNDCSVRHRMHQNLWITMPYESISP